MVATIVIAAIIIVATDRWVLQWVLQLILVPVGTGVWVLVGTGQLVLLGTRVSTGNRLVQSSQPPVWP